MVKVKPGPAKCVIVYGLVELKQKIDAIPPACWTRARPSDTRPSEGRAVGRAIGNRRRGSNCWAGTFQLPAPVPTTSRLPAEGPPPFHSSRPSMRKELRGERKKKVGICAMVKSLFRKYPSTSVTIKADSFHKAR